MSFFYEMVRLGKMETIRGDPRLASRKPRGDPRLASRKAQGEEKEQLLPTPIKVAYSGIAQPWPVTGKHHFQADSLFQARGRAPVL